MASKRSDGRGETILDPELEIIDTHHHLFLRPHVRYLFDEFLDDVGAGHKIVASVYVDAQSMVRPSGDGMFRPLGEVEFANGMAAMSASGLFGPSRIAAAIIASAKLSEGDRIADYLDAALGLAPNRLKGVRQITFQHPSEALKPLMRYHSPPGVLGSDAFRAGFRHLRSRGLLFESVVFHTQLAELSSLADAHPDTAIVLNHLGIAMMVGLNEVERGETFEAWRTELRKTAQRPNIHCKIGGLGMPYWNLGFDRRAGPARSTELAAAWKPYVETAIEAFGIERCVMESNFPVDGASCGYVPLWNALKLTTRGYADGERQRLFRDNAARLYGIDLAVPYG